MYEEEIHPQIFSASERLIDLSTKAGEKLRDTSSRLIRGGGHMALAGLSLVLVKVLNECDYYPQGLNTNPTVPTIQNETVQGE